MRKIYPIHQSPFYKLQSKAKLAELLGLSRYNLQRIADRPDNYNIFDIQKGDGKRTVEEPKPLLKRIHRRIFKLLGRIQSPNYLHSGTKSRSHITNALAHSGQSQLYKVDIKNFYTATPTSSVYRYFSKYLMCSNDVAALLSKLTTVQGHIPTGSPLSQLLAFSASKDMFDELCRLSHKYHLTMTCYVDDITFSGATISNRFIWEVQGIIRKHGHQHHKEKTYRTGAPKLVTGVILKGKDSFVRNAHQERIHENLMELSTSQGEAIQPLFRRVVGQLTSAGQIEDRFKHTAESLRSKYTD